MVSIQRVLKFQWWRFPITWWWRSLPLRVVLTVFVASVLVLVLGGFLLMQQATIGVIDGKKETAKNEARQAVNTAQQQLDAADLTGNVNADKLLLDLATGFATNRGHFDTDVGMTTRSAVVASCRCRHEVMFSTARSLRLPKILCKWMWAARSSGQRCRPITAGCPCAAMPHTSPTGRRMS